SHHYAVLWDVARRPSRLVVDGGAEVYAVGEHLVLQRQERTARVDEVGAGQAVLAGDLLRAQVLLDRHREVGAALDRGVVGDHHHFLALYAAYAADHAGGGRGIVVHAFGGQRRDFEEWRTRVEQGGDAVTRQQLAACDVLVAGLVAATSDCARKSRIELFDQRAVIGNVVLEFPRARVEG